MLDSSVKFFSWYIKVTRWFLSFILLLWCSANWFSHGLNQACSPGLSPAQFLCAFPFFIVHASGLGFLTLFQELLRLYSWEHSFADFLQCLWFWYRGNDTYFIESVRRCLLLFSFWKFVKGHMNSFLPVCRVLQWSPTDLGFSWQDLKKIFSTNLVFLLVTNCSYFLFLLHQFWWFVSFLEFVCVI